MTGIESLFHTLRRHGWQTHYSCCSKPHVQTERPLTQPNEKSTAANFNWFCRPSEELRLYCCVGSKVICTFLHNLPNLIMQDCNYKRVYYCCKNNFKICEKILTLLVCTQRAAISILLKKNSSSTLSRWQVETSLSNIKFDSWNCSCEMQADSTSAN